MSARIYKPGASGSGIAQPGETKPEGGHPDNDTGHHGEGHEVQPFPLERLPEAAADMARAICEVERTPASLAGVCTLGFISAAIGRGLHVQSGPDRFTRGNLYLVASAESGSGKSETFRHAARPFFDFERELVEAWRTSTLPGLQAERDILEAEIANLKKEAGKADGALERDGIKTRLETKKAGLLALEAMLHSPALSVEDVTTERLAGMLSQRGETLASLSADAGAIVNNLLGRYSKLERTDEGLYLKAFSGDFCKVDRQKGDPVLLLSPCLAALWLTQPDKVETLLGERSLTDGGLIPRLLICHTHCQPRPIIGDAQPIAAATVAAYRAMLRGLLESYRLEAEALTIQPSPEASKAMEAHFNGIVTRRLADLRDVTTYAARWNEQAWRIAVCLHAGRWGQEAHEQTLELDTAEDAIALADWFAAQQLEILSAGRHRGRRKIRDEVLALLADNPKGIRASDIYRARITRNADEAHTLLATMEAESELTGRDDKPEGGGHVTRIYTKARK